MPNYLYKCVVCDYSESHELPMSFDPKAKLLCRECETSTGFGEDRMTRRIVPFGSVGFKNKKLGDWYKEQTGKNLLE